MSFSITPRDKNTKAITDYHRIVPINFLCEAIGTKYSIYRSRVSRLAEHNLLHLAPGQKLDKRGTSGYTKKKFLLYQSGGQRDYDWSPHTLMQALVELNFHIAAPKLGLKYLPWPHIQALPQTPLETSRSKHPLKLSVERDGEIVQFSPDGHNWHLAGPKGAFSFLLEADRDTERNTTIKDSHARTIEAKLRNYIKTFVSKEKRDTINFASPQQVGAWLFGDLGLPVLAFTDKGKSGVSPCEKHFGFPSTFILFVTTSELKCAHFQKLLLDITNGKGASNILFKSFPDYLEMDGSIKPDSSFVAEPWSRAGHEPINLVERLGGQIIK